MANPATIEDFVDLVRKSGLLEEKRLESFLQRVRGAGVGAQEPGKLAGHFVQEGLLTHFQAEQIMQGRWKRFTIGKYKVLERLGSGGMGLVYLCEHKLMRRRVAVKVLPSAKANDPAALERFQREARAAAALDHPNIVHAYDIDQDGELHFLVMEYVEGASLQEIVKRSGRLEANRAAHYIRQAALGLEHAHAAGLVHRDIKPGNILVDRTGTVKVLDMGLARFFNDEDDVLTRKYDENVLGTADYLAPEQIDDSHTVDIRADIYSLGMTFYFLLSGQAPFGPGSVAQKLIWQQTRLPKEITAVRSDVPEGLAAVLTRMLAKKPQERFQVPGQVAEALAPFTQTPIAPPPEHEMPSRGAAASADGVTAVSKGSGTPGPRHGPVAAPPRTAVAATLAPLTAPATNEPFDSPWGGLTGDTVDPTARADTAPQTRARTVTAGAEKAVKRERRRFWRIVAALSSICFLGAVFLVWKFVLAGGGDPVPKVRGPLQVTRDAGVPNSFRTIQAALRTAQPGDVIELCDGLHRENLYVHPSRGATEVTIQAKSGAEIVWKPAKEDDKQLIWLSRASGFRIKGKRLTLDGTIDESKKLKIDALIFATGHSPGLRLEDLTLTNFGKYGVHIMNCTGDVKGEWVRLINLSMMMGKGDLPLAAVFFDADPNTQPAKNDAIDISGGDFQILPIREKHIAVNGPNIKGKR